MWEHALYGLLFRMHCETSIFSVDRVSINPNGMIDMTETKVIEPVNADELKTRTQEHFKLKQMAEFSPIVNTMIDYHL